MTDRDPPPDGCALCGSTWGDIWEEIDGRERFFCCWICARAFENMVRTVKDRTGWPRVDDIDIIGDFKGRDCTARQGSDDFDFHIEFDSSTGEIETFEELPRG